MLVQNVSKLTAMVRACNTGWACNVLNVLTILYMVVSRTILRLSSSECQFKSFRAGLMFEAGLR